MISVAKENFRNNRGGGFRLENPNDPALGEDYGIPLSAEQRACLADIKAHASVD